MNPLETLLEKHCAPECNRNDWVRAALICGALGMNCNERSKRKIRQLAAESGGRIISGNRGYKLTKYATPEEICAAMARIRHQTIEMNHRLFEIAFAAKTAGKEINQ